MSVDFEITQLANAIRSAPRSKRTDTYPPAIIHKTLVLAKRLCPKTYSHNYLAKLLGLSPKTVTNWLAKKSLVPAMVPIVVSTPVSPISRADPPHFCLHGPCGTRVDNLSLEQLTALLKALS